MRRSLPHAALAALACAAMALAFVALATRPARAAEPGCTGPFTLAISGSNGSSTDQPAAQPVQLTVLDAADIPGSDICPLGRSGGPAGMHYTWRGPSTGFTFDSVHGSTAVLTFPIAGTFSFRVDITQDFAADPVQSLTVALRFARAPDPTITVQSPVTAGEPTLLTGVPNELLQPRAPQEPAASIYSMSWAFGDGTTGGALGSSIQHVFTARGTYTVEGRFFTGDSHGGLQDLGRARVPVQVLAPVDPAFIAPTTAELGAPVTVDGSPSTTDAAATVTGYAWDFGDGGRGTGVSPTHVYWTTGTFTITETVTDSLGRSASTAHALTVTPSTTGGPTPTGTPPVAAFTVPTASPTAGSPVSFDGTGSADPDGAVVDYAWTFGDGGTAAGATPRHTFGDHGSFPVTLTVTDDDGLSRSTTQLLAVADAPPTAAFASTPASPVAGSPVSFDGAGSGDLDGAVQQYAWSFGDGGAATGPTASHAYAQAGSYDVVLTVTDDAGLTGTVTHAVTVGNAAPVADLVLPPGAIASGPLTFDGTPSSDADGTVVGYAWTFGDGATGTGPTPSHVFARPGRYTIALTVTDDDGLTGSASRTLDVAGASPLAAFTAPTGAAGVLTAFDGTSSSDPDGTIRTYAWDFGDGGTATGATPGHSFTEPNSYPVTLTVTDDDGLVGSVTHLVAIGTVLPTAAFVSGSAAPVVGSPVAFDGSGSAVPGGVISGYDWTFGDGGTATGVRPNHTYRAPGSYPVTLTVTDGAGHTASVTQVLAAHWPATDLAVAIGGSAPRPGQYTYRVTVKNLGRTGAHGIVLTNALDPTQALASAVTAPAGLTCGGVPVGATGTITCRAPSAVLAAGRTWVVTFTVRQPSRARAAQVTEVSTVRAANPDTVPRNDTARRTTAV
jgi:uncharacterized repeat protein (TIGR01451 family)